MQTAIKGRAAPQKKQQMSRQLEDIFHAVDLIKSDLSRCGKGMNGRDPAPFSTGHNFFKIRSREKTVCTVNYRYRPQCQVLTRRNGRGKAEVIISGVTDFFITFFTESSSVLYRLEINQKEQIRGYIFLPHLKNKEE